MNEQKAFYERYWQDKHIKINPFDHRPNGFTDENFMWHLKFFKPFIKGKLLDFGCGDGNFASRISSYCDSVCGVDIAEIPINQAILNYPKIEFKLLENGVNIPYPDSYFDCIVALDVLEHILDIEHVLKELNRVLKSGGSLLITTSELTRIKIILIALTSLDNYFYPTSPHIRYFTRKNLEDILGREGFKVQEYIKNRTYFGFIPQGQMVVALKKY